MIVVHSVRAYRDIEVYWGIEREVAEGDRKVLSWAFLVEDMPPFRRSLWGFRLSMFGKAFHTGRCERASDPHRRLGGIDQIEISKWRGPSGVEEEASTDPGGEPVRPDERGGPIPGAGGGPDQRQPHDDGVPAAAQ